MTMALYEKRLAHYPRLIQLTEPLRGSRIAASPADATYFSQVLQAVDEWHASEAGLILSVNAQNTLYQFREALRQPPQHVMGKFSADQIASVMESKKRLRSALRQDLRLLYREEGLAGTNASSSQP